MIRRLQTVDIRELWHLVNTKWSSFARLIRVQSVMSQVSIGPAGVSSSVAARFSQRGRAYMLVKCTVFIDFALNWIFVEIDGSPERLGWKIVAGVF